MRSMPSSDPRVRLLHIRDNIHLARSFVADLSYDAFRADTLRVYAVTRCFEIISEASRRLPEAVKARHPHHPLERDGRGGKRLSP